MIKLFITELNEDVDYKDNLIYSENGKRHMIYWTTGTVIIDEN